MANNYRDLISQRAAAADDLLNWKNRLFCVAVAVLFVVVCYGRRSSALGRC